MSERPALGRGVAAVMTIALVSLFIYAVSSASRITHGFVSYHAAARLLLDGQLGPDAYDDGWFGRYVQGMTGTNVLEIFTPNPPMMAWMATPVARLEPRTARAVWLLASLTAAFVTAVALARHRSRLQAAWPAAVMAIVLLNPAMFANLRTGQGYLFVFALLGGAALLLIAGRDRWAGALAGAAIACKSVVCHCYFWPPGMAAGEP